MIKPIRIWPDPILLTPTNLWDHQNPQIECEQLEKDLTDTLLAENALGLAANQIGVQYRILAINTQDDNNIRIMYNPVILFESKEDELSYEGCLSFPKIRLEIPRSNYVEVSWRDKLNYVHSRRFTGIDARCILHEIDHLNGIVFKQYVSNLKFNHALKQAKN